MTTATEHQGQTATPVDLVICDDAALNRECLALALESRGMKVECVDDLPALLGRFSRSVPEVILLNIDTPDSAMLLQVSQDVAPDARLIVTGLSADREAAIVACAEAGVAGLHLRTESLDELVSLVRNPHNGDALCSQRISSILVRKVYSLVGQRSSNPKSNPVLSQREAQIMTLIEEGLSNQQIASRLNVTIHTVKNHAHSLFGKLGVRSRSEAVAAYRALR